MRNGGDEERRGRALRPDRAGNLVASADTDTWYPYLPRKRTDF